MDRDEEEKEEKDGKEGLGRAASDPQHRDHPRRIKSGAGGGTAGRGRTGAQAARRIGSPMKLMHSIRRLMAQYIESLTAAKERTTEEMRAHEPGAGAEGGDEDAHDDAVRLGHQLPLGPGPPIPEDLKDTCKRKWLHLRRKEHRWAKLFNGFVKLKEIGLGDARGRSGRGSGKARPRGPAMLREAPRGSAKLCEVSRGFPMLREALQSSARLREAREAPRVRPCEALRGPAGLREAFCEAFREDPPGRLRRGWLGTPTIGFLAKPPDAPPFVTPRALRGTVPASIQTDPRS